MDFSCPYTYTRSSYMHTNSMYENVIFLKGKGKWREMKSMLSLETKWNEWKNNVSENWIFKLVAKRQTLKRQGESKQEAKCIYPFMWNWMSNSSPSPTWKIMNRCLFLDSIKAEIFNFWTFSEIKSKTDYLIYDQGHFLNCKFLVFPPILEETL